MKKMMAITALFLITIGMAGMMLQPSWTSMSYLMNAEEHPEKESKEKETKDKLPLAHRQNPCSPDVSSVNTHRYLYFLPSVHQPILTPPPDCC